ncbi:MAG: FAD-binding protein [Candidatus Aramenus sp.]|nr:FAD-binding protein [Candidatus Aramenus sp.]
MVEGGEVIVGRGTSLDGSLLRNLNPKYLSAVNRLEDGSVFSILEKGNIYAKARVAPGATFEELFNSLAKEGYYPALFPLYPKGTVGGFIATNGSGFGSYKFGFVKYKKAVHENGEKGSIVTLVKYDEVIEVSQEEKLSWSSLIIDGTKRYFVPSIYSSLVSGKSISVKELVNEVFGASYRLVKKDYVPICLRTTDPSLFNGFPGELVIGYEVNFNSPAKYTVMCGSVKADELEEVFNFLRKNPGVIPFPNLRDYDDLQKQILSKYKRRVKIPKHAEFIRDEYIDATRCVNCSLCLDSCLAYKTTKNVFYSAMGKLNRLVTEETAFEACFGCKECEDACPEGIKISKITEVLPRVGSNLKVSISLESSSLRAKELEKQLEDKFRSRPRFLLFVGCSAKYDPVGLEGFLKFLMDNGDKISTSPRVKLIDGMCCGFDKYISGDVEGARRDVQRILELKKTNGAEGVYFLCPEGLYVYNALSGEKGYFAFEVIKPFISEPIHAGCWARKLGVEGQDKECAGLSLTSYMGGQVYMRQKNILTVCPFSTWKFGTRSVYSKFYSAEASKVRVIAGETVTLPDTVMVEIIVNAIRDASLRSVDEIASKVDLWKVGGRNYFVLVVIPIVRKEFTSVLRAKLADDANVVKFLKVLVEDQILLNEKVSKYVDAVRSYDVEPIVREIVQRVSNSRNLAFENKDVVESQSFSEALRDVLKSIATASTLQTIIVEVASAS